jgi:hypothetical protein
MKILFVNILLGIFCILNAQEKIVVFDFEKPVEVNGWWVDNTDIKLSQFIETEGTDSNNCLRIIWENIPLDKASTWMTDLKISTFSEKEMECKWTDYQDETWLSFKAKTSGADSIFFQIVIFTENEKDKWGSQEIISLNSRDWQPVKIKLSSLHYDNWGNGNIPAPDFRKIVPAIIEIGIRNGKVSGRIDARIDDITITNYEPMAINEK